ncbi:MAG: putative AlkP superfamily pyrophosphatase or phosphodiesterase [Planctomycetota bacterium]|jgi:predicted AlkP superfamily pyrophosphatase or phosphodiesterase
MIFLSAVLACSSLIAPSQETIAPQPRLVVVIGVDQMIPEQLDRLAPFFTGGYGRFVQSGLNYRSAQLEHSKTETGPGYATLGTGCHPKTNGIVANAWFKPDGTGYTYCVGDAESKLVVGSDLPPSTGSGVSPRNLRVPALGDWLKGSDPESLVVSLAGKDRAAVGMGGRQPDLCLWWNKSMAGFASSDWYAEELPGWVENWNGEVTSRVLDSEWGTLGWKLNLPENIESAGTAPDRRQGESSRVSINRNLMVGHNETEPSQRRAILGAAAYRSPIVDQLTIEMARRSVEELKLGADEHPDLLMLGLSACDVIGHGFGPYSTEVTDLLLRIDVELGLFFDYLDETVGVDQWSAVLTADHGVLMLPEEGQKRGINATRLATASSAFAAAHEHVQAEYGQDFIAMISETGIRLDLAALEAAQVNPAEVRASLAAVMSKASWMERTFTLEELASGNSSEDAFLRLAQNCYDAERSPDVVFQRRPWILFGPSSGTSHGSPYGYDRRVPLVFLGAGIQPGRRFDSASTADVAPTVLVQLGIKVPAEMDGQALELR